VDKPSEDELAALAHQQEKADNYAHAVGEPDLFLGHWAHPDDGQLDDDQDDDERSERHDRVIDLRDEQV
jgi:hypothetical protein